MTPVNHAKPVVIEWDWSLEHADRKREAKADAAIHGAQPFHVDRGVLKAVIREKLDCRVARIEFLNSGASRLFPLPKFFSWHTPWAAP